MPAGMEFCDDKRAAMKTLTEESKKFVDFYFFTFFAIVKLG